MELARLHTWDWEKWMKWNTPNTQQACRSAAKGHQIPHKVEDGSQSKTDHSGQLLSARRQITQDNCYQPEDKSHWTTAISQKTDHLDNYCQPEDRSPRTTVISQKTDHSGQLLFIRRQITEDNCYQPEDRSLSTTTISQKTDHSRPLLCIIHLSPRPVKGWKHTLLVWNLSY